MEEELEGLEVMAAMDEYEEMGEDDASYPCTFCYLSDDGDSFPSFFLSLGYFVFLVLPMATFMVSLHLMREKKGDT